MMSSAVQAVVETTELLENILFFLPLYSLVTCQRVCKQFQALIGSSVVLQTELFRRPNDGRPRWTAVRRSGKDPMELVRATTQNGFLPSRSVDEKQSGSQRPLRLHLSRLHPFLQHIWLEEVDHQRWPTLIERVCVRSQEFELRHDLYFRAGHASWLNMYLCDPPCTSVSGKVTFRVSLKPPRLVTTMVKLKNPMGVSWSQLIDTALSNPRPNSGQAWPVQCKTVADCVGYLEELAGEEAYVQADEVAPFPADTTMFYLSGVVNPQPHEWQELYSMAEA